MLWSGVFFLALSERPRSAPTALSPRTHFIHALAPVFAGLITLFFSGLLGLILFYRPPPFATSPLSNFSPAIIGLFLIPGLLIHLSPPRATVLMALSGFLILIAITTGWAGLLILLTSTGIGLLPVLFQARRIQGVGLILIPLAFALTK